jgi:ArsR family transcriptional regulator
MPDIPGRKAEFFKTLGHPARIRVLELLAERERTVTELLGEMEVEQPYLSQHLALLRRADFVLTRREGTRIVYALADERLADLLRVSREILIDLHTATSDELRRAS